jgi:hypothetical protein
VDLRHQRVAAVIERLRGRMHDAAVGDRLRLVRAHAGELGDVVAGRERLFAGAAQDDAAQAVVGRQAAHRIAQALPHLARERIELVGTVEHDGGDRTVALDQDEIIHPSSP